MLRLTSATALALLLAAPAIAQDSPVPITTSPEKADEAELQTPKPAPKSGCMGDKQVMS